MLLQLVRSNSDPKPTELPTKFSAVTTVITIDNDTESLQISSTKDPQYSTDSDTERTTSDSQDEKRSWLTASFPSLILFALIMISAVLGRQYIKDMLIYIDTLDVWESAVLFGVMFTVVSFPIMWGYVLLNIACGYTFGFLYGTLMTAGCVTYAIICSHLIIRRFFKVCMSVIMIAIYTKLQPSSHTGLVMICVKLLVPYWR